MRGKWSLFWAAADRAELACVLSADLNVLWPLPQSGESWLLPGKSRVMTWNSHQRPGVSQQTQVLVPALPLTSWITYTFPHLDIEGGG